MARKLHYLLFYEADADYEERRKPFRAAHLAHARAAADRGDVVLGGAFAHPIDGAVILFRGDSPSAAEAFAEKRSVRREWRGETLVCTRVDDCGGKGRGDQN